MLLWSLLSVLVMIGLSWAMSTGPPNNAQIVCEGISPDPAFHLALPSDGNGGYVIATDIPLNGSYYRYDEGTNYTVQVRHLDGNAAFRGFLVQARDPSGDAIGTFMPQTGQRLVDCSHRNRPVGAQIGHSRPTEVETQTFTWQAPPGNRTSMVDFRYAVVQERRVYFADQSAAESAAAANVEIGIVTPTEAPTIAIPERISMPRRSPDDYRLRIRDPENCTVSSCNLFVGIDTNEGDSEFLDVYIEGNAAGWVAVGFSPTPNMFSTDVLACSINTRFNLVEVLDTWNPTDTRANHLVDPTKDVRVFTATSENNRIMCSFARRIEGSDPAPQDFNLSSAYYILYGASPNSFPGSHNLGPTGNPQITTEQINPARDSRNIGVTDAPPVSRGSLSRAQGIFVVMALVLAVATIFSVA